MKESLSNRVAALIKKARSNGLQREIKSVDNSSLHQVIKTKAQADLFMKLLKYKPTIRVGFLLNQFIVNSTIFSVDLKKSSPKINLSIK